MAEHFSVLIDWLPKIGIEGIWLAFWVFFLIAVGISFWFFFSRLKERHDYEGTPICKMRITIMKKYTLEGNLSENDSFDDEKLSQFREQKDLKVITGIVENLIKNGELYLYNFKVTDDTEATDDFPDKTRIFSPVKIETPEYSWQSQKGKRMFEKFFLVSEKRQNCVFYSTTQRLTIYDEDGHEEDWWIASPMPMVEGKKYVTLRDNPFPDAPVHAINITKMEALRAVAEYASASTTIAKALGYNKHIIRERDDYHELYDKSLEENETVNMEKNQLEEELAQKKYIDTGREDRKLALHDFTWAIVGAVCGGFGAVMLPEAFPTYNPMLTAFGGIALGLLFAGIIFKYFVATKKTEVTRKVEE